MPKSGKTFTKNSASQSSQSNGVQNPARYKEKYQLLLNSIEEGFCIIEVLFDKNKHPYDYRFLEVNSAFEKQTGIHNAVGKTMKTIAPSHEQYWFDIYGKIAQTGKPSRFDNAADALGYYYEVYAFRIGKKGENMVGIIFKDIKERRQSESRQSLLLKLSDALVPLSDPKNVASSVTQIALDFFATDRCCYCEIEGENVVIRHEAYRSNLCSIAGTYPLADFALFKKVTDADVPFVINNIHTTSNLDKYAKQCCLNMQIISLLALPMNKDGKSSSILCLAQSTIREWRYFEIQLAIEIAERTWEAKERAKISADLKKSEARLKLATVGGKVGTFLYYPKERRTDPDNQMLDIWGLSHSGVPNFAKAMAEAIYTEDRIRYGRDILKAIDPAGNGRLHSDIRISHSDGSLYWINVTAQVTFKNGEAVKISGVCTDITKNKKNEIALGKSESNYRIMVNQAIAGISKIDMNGRIIFANEQMARMLGYDIKELLRLTVNDIVHPKDRKRNHTLFNRLKTQTSYAYTIEKRLLCKDGHYIWVNNQVSPIVDDKSRFISAIIISIDISEQKAIEKQKNDFIGIASHELKTPLTGIKAYSQLLLDTFSDKKDAHAASIILKLNRQVDRLNRLIYGLLDTTLISEGRFDLQYEEFDLRKLTEERVSELKMTAPRYKFTVNSDKIKLIYADPERIGQVLTNLITNAVRYSPDADKVIITIEDLGHQKVKVSVRDFGFGVSPGLRNKIFKRFYRHLNSGNASGFGLGLYISNEIIKKHSGEMGIESPESGSIFYFILPYKPSKN